MELSSELAANADVIAGLFKRIGDFEERLKSATASTPAATTAASTDLQTLSREFAEFKLLVWQSLSKLKTQTDLLARGFDRHETFLRRKVLLFHGIAEMKDEKVNEVVLKVITNKMQLPDYTLGDLQASHRLGTSTSKPRPILVRFRDLEQRRLVWDSKTSLRDSGIIISEFLTKTRHDVFMAARKHFGIVNCWTTDGRIVILLPDKTRRKIEVAAELNCLTAAFPTIKTSTPAAETGDGRARPVVPAKSVSRSVAASRKLRNKPT